MSDERAELAKRLERYAVEYEKVVVRSAGVGRMVADLRAAAAELARDV